MLAPGWEVVTDPVTRKPYCNRRTEESSWERPVAVLAVAYFSAA